MPKKINLMIQRASRLKNIPDNKDLLKWAESALAVNPLKCQKVSQADVTIRIMNKKESAHLNKTYRNKKGPANILSFGYEKHPVLRGDIALCAPLIFSRQNWAHLVIHGILHLRDYNHALSSQAKIMENLEIKLLKQSGFNNPYVF